MTTQIAKEYAEALFGLAAEAGDTRRIGDALKEASDMLRRYPEYMELLASPAVHKDERAKLVDEAFGPVFPEYVVSFLQLLCRRGRIRSLDACIEAYEALYRASMHTAAARITSAVALTEQEKTSLMQKLHSTYGYKVLPEYIVDASIMGGLIVEMDGRVIDGSLRRRPREIKEVINR